MLSGRVLCRYDTSCFDENNGNHCDLHDRRRNTPPSLYYVELEFVDPSAVACYAAVVFSIVVDFLADFDVAVVAAFVALVDSDVFAAGAPAAAEPVAAVALVDYDANAEAADAVAPVDAETGSPVGIDAIAPASVADVDNGFCTIAPRCSFAGNGCTDH